MSNPKKFKLFTAEHLCTSKNQLQSMQEQERNHYSYRYGIHYNVPVLFVVAFFLSSTKQKANFISTASISAKVLISVTNLYIAKKNFGIDHNSPCAF